VLRASSAETLLSFIRTSLRSPSVLGAPPLRRYDGATIAAVCVAAWVEDSSVGSFSEKYLADLREETDALTPQLL